MAAISNRKQKSPSGLIGIIGNKRIQNTLSMGKKKGGRGEKRTSGLKLKNNPKRLQRKRNIRASILTRKEKNLSLTNEQKADDVRSHSNNNCQ